MSRVFLYGFVSLCLSFFAAATASADLFYNIVFDQPNYSANEGGTVAVNVLLRETATNGDTARLAPGNSDGLFSFGLNTDFSIVSGGSGSIVSDIDAVQENPDFTFETGVGGKPDAVTVRSSDVDYSADQRTGFDGVSGTLISSIGGTDIYELGLVTLTFDAGALGSNTQITLADHTDTNVITIFADAATIDAVASYGSANIIVAGIPEPTSLLILGSLLVGGTLRRRRK